MKNNALTTTRALELEYRQLWGSHPAGIGSDPSMLMEEIGDRPLLYELAVFANAIWVSEIRRPLRAVKGSARFLCLSLSVVAVCFARSDAVTSVTAQITAQ